MVFSEIAQKALNGLSTTTSTHAINNNDPMIIIAPEGLTLEMVLLNQTSSPFSLKDFSDYLKATYCNENLLFYEAVTEYKQRCIAYFNLDEDEQKPEPVLLSDGKTFFDFSIKSIHVLSRREKTWFETLKSKFEFILKEFILSDGEQEINIPYETRHQLLQSYRTQQSYHPALLYPACSAVVELLRISAFIPFATDPYRYYCPMKKKKSFSSNKSKHVITTTATEVIPPLPTPPLPIPEPSSSNFLKRITTTFKFRYSSSNNNGTSTSTSTNEVPDSPPMSPPSRLTSWKQINIPDLSSFKNPPTVEKSSIVTPSNIITSSSVSTSSCSTISSNISTTTKSRPTSN